jgi:hypothetical protein
MGWEKRQRQDQGESPGDLIGSMWSMIGPTLGLPNSGGSVADSAAAAAAGAGGWLGGGGGGGSMTSMMELFGGMYDEPRREYSPMGQGSAEAVQKAGGLREDELVYTAF